MAFFEENNKEEETIQQDNITSDSEEEVQELEVNRIKREEYEKLMEKAKGSTDSYYDNDNIFVKIVLGLLFVFIVCGVVYYTLLYLRAK